MTRKSNILRRIRKVSDAFWDELGKDKSVKIKGEKPEIVWQIPKDFSGCRFEVIDQDKRRVLCTVCREKFGVEHGLFLFPPHKWELKKGIVYKKLKSGKLVRWRGYKDLDTL